MKILLTGASGYIGKRLLPNLLEHGHEVILLYRLIPPPIPENFKERVRLIQGDLADLSTLPNLGSLDAAYFLVHSMRDAAFFADKESKVAHNFLQWIDQSGCKKIIYLSGLHPEALKLSQHLQSRIAVEAILSSSHIPLITLRTGIVIGSGSASFELIRDLTEKLPIMILPKWTAHRCDIIALMDLLFFLESLLTCEKSETFDLSNGQKLTFRDLLEGFAKVRGLKRFVIPVPFLTPSLSSWWLFIVSSVDFLLARALVESLRHDFIARDDRIWKRFPKEAMSYEQALKRAFAKIEEQEVISSWDDHWRVPQINPHLEQFASIPSYGCYVERASHPFPKEARERVLKAVFEIGGDRGWYFMDFAWKIRGFFDRLFGGVGLRRGRRVKLEAGQPLDFWRVIIADEKKGRLFLYAEMKLPGEGWLEFRVESDKLITTASFRPKGVLGRLYWIILWPVHLLIFRGMAKKISSA